MVPPLRRMMACSVALAAMLMAFASAQARSPRLDVAPAAEAPVIPPGMSEIESGLLYRPEGVGEGPLPLIVMFHGAISRAPRMIEWLSPEADRCGCLLLAVAARGSTWDLIERARRRGGQSSLDRLFGTDADAVERTLSLLLASPLVDRRRIVFAGFSDGASYALSLGLANPGLVRGIVALAPGFLIAPDRIDTEQRLFVAHSPEDRVLSFENSRDGIFRPLEQAGMTAMFRSFPGGHGIDPRIFSEGVGHVLAAQAPLP